MNIVFNICGFITVTFTLFLVPVSGIVKHGFARTVSLVVNNIDLVSVCFVAGPRVLVIPVVNINVT